MAVKLEAMADQLETAKSKWQSKVLPKLQPKDAQRWQARGINLPRWSEEISHIKACFPQAMLWIMQPMILQEILVIDPNPGRWPVSGAFGCVG